MDHETNVSRLHASLLGGSLAVLTAVAIHAPFVEFGVPLLSLLLSFTACVYVGALLAQRQSASVVFVEVSVCIVVFLCSLLGSLHSVVWLAAGYAVHGVWDWAHERRVVPTLVATWFPPFCATFDFLIAGFILVFVG